MNANLIASANSIAAQPSPSAAVNKFLALKPRLFINGEWVEARSGKTIKVFDPATGREIGQAADATISWTRTCRSAATSSRVWGASTAGWR